MVISSQWLCTELGNRTDRAPAKNQMSHKKPTQMTEALHVILRVSAQYWTTWMSTDRLSDTM